MTKAQQRFKNWIIAHIGKPEQMTELDNKVLDIIIVQVPQFFGLVLAFTIFSALYLWGLKKYGFERTLIVLLVNMVIAISQVSKAIHELLQ
jgi:nucleosome binding factor SPN SPT16 subunit